MLTGLPSNALRKSIDDNMRHAPSSYYSIIIIMLWKKGVLVPLSLLVTVYTLYPLTRYY